MGVEPTLLEVVAFLLGEEPLRGCYFGDPKPDGERGNFWWRRDLRAALSADTRPAPSGPIALGEDERETLARYKAALQDIAEASLIPTPIEAFEWCRDVANAALDAGRE